MQSYTTSVQFLRQCQLFGMTAKIGESYQSMSDHHIQLDCSGLSVMSLQCLLYR